MTEITVSFSGPFFAANAIEKLRSIGENTIRQLVEMGHERLSNMLQPRPTGVYLSASEAGPGRVSTGYYRQHIHDECDGMHGRIDDGNVIYGNWLEGTSSRNQSTRFKGYASFRKTHDWIETQVDPVARAWCLKIISEGGFS